MSRVEFAGGFKGRYEELEETRLVWDLRGHSDMGPLFKGLRDAAPVSTRGRSMTILGQLFRKCPNSG